MRPRTRLAYCAACIGAAILAIGVSLMAMSAIVLVLGASGAGGVALSGHPLHVAVDDGAVALYLSQLVSVTFFNHTAGLRFAPLPGLALVAVAIATSAMVAVRLVGGSARKRMLLAMLIPIPYALLSGIGARYLPLSFTGPGIGRDTAVLPATIEAFLLPLSWGLLFAPVGGLVGVFGRRWRHEASRLLGAWATPVRCSLRALALGLALTSLAVIVGGAALVGQSGAARSLVDGRVGHVVAVLGGAVIALPTLVLTLFLGCFGVSFDWQVEALSRTQGSGSILGGTLPTTSASPVHAIPGLLVLLLLLATVTVLSAGWLTARRSEENVRLSMANALRTGALMTLICWLFGLLARVDAQAGGYLGLHFEADPGSLLWRVPLWCFLGSIAGSVAYLATRGTSSRRQLAAALLAGARPPGRPHALHGWLASWRQGLATRAALGISFLSLPAMLIGIGSAGATTATPPATVSLAPISQAAEQRLRTDAVPGSRLSVSVDPSTRVIDSASVRIPLDALGISPDQSPIVKAKAVLAHYGDLFGTSGQPGELGDPQVVTDPITKTQSHVYFKQMVDGLPVFGNSIGVHFSPDGKYLDFVNGSFVPEVALADHTAAINSTQAVSLAKAALPDGNLVHPPRLEVYIGTPSHQFGPTARLAWFVWLTAGPLNASTEYVIDATNGSILHAFPKAFNVKDREIYNANEEVKNLPGTLKRAEGEGPTGDEDTNHAYEYLGEAYKFYKEEENCRLSSYNCGGEPMIATVHYGKEYKEAEWYPGGPDGPEIVFGTGYPAAIDVVGHEFTEGITEHFTNEIDEGETGALAEGFADAMGKSIEAFAKEFKEEPNWTYGANAPGGPFRNLKEPNKKDEISGHPDPEKLSEYVTVCQDNDGIHENSTIISHAFYLLATKLGTDTGIEEAQKIFYLMQTMYLKGLRFATFEQARDAALAAARDIYKEGSKQLKETEAAFNAVGLNGIAKPPPFECNPEKCPFADALQDQEPAHGTTSTLGMLATLYRARGELAQSSAAGRHFLPLYEENMGRITELVSRDPTLEEIAVGGLQQITPALNALSEGEGQKFTLSASEMAEIEASLKRLAQDDRIFSGGGSLAQLIERELRWLRLPTYAGTTYTKGFARLNKAVVRHSEKAPPPATFLVDPNCSGTPYGNEFQIRGFTVGTPGHYNPGEASPIVASGVACGTKVEKSAEGTACHDTEGPLNTGLTLELPAGDKVNSTKELTNGSYVGKVSGRVLTCVGEDSEMIYGVAGIKSLNTWTTQCPEGATACYEVEGTYKGHEGHGYAWVKEESDKRLVLTTGPSHVEISGSKLPIGFAQFGVELCALAGEPGVEACGTAASHWVHKNGEENQPECSTEKEGARYVLRVTNSAAETTLAAQRCVYWGEEAHKQAIDTGNSVSAVACVPETTDCAVTDSTGKALYSTNVSTTSAGTWTSWSGPTSPGEAIACPTSALCALGDGKVSGGGGDMYYATSLGGSWSEAFKPTHGVLAVSCPSSSFCVDSQESGHIRYSAKPASTEWTELTVGSGSMNGVFCLSSSFCAAVNGSGDLYVANTEAHIKEASGWKLTDIDGSTALHGVACTSTTSCVAVDGAGDVLDLTINSGGEAATAKHDIDGANDLAAITCRGGFTCVAVDSTGDVFVSTSGGETWNNQHALETDLTSVSCASISLCVVADTTGHVTAFAPTGVPSSSTQTIDTSKSLSAVSCVPETTDCVATDSTGKAVYSTAVSANSTAKWTSWSGPASPSEAVACPASSLCTLADGHVEEGSGGNVYYATSLGGSWTEAFSPAYGVLAISCPSSSFCVDGQAGHGYIRYSTKPASGEWTSLSIGSGAMNAVDCLSSSFCAVVDSSGNVHIADTEAKVKEASGWKSTDIDGSTGLHGVACTSTTSCVAVDGEGDGDIFDLTINGSGEATVSKHGIDGTNDLTAITCTEGFMCVAVDSKGNVFVSSDSGETWKNEHTLGTDLTSVSCSTSALCVATDTTGEVTAFEAE
jgi:Zn-dependent metalloprotease